MDKGTVLVTGASTGIGEACALRLARAGFNVVAGVRKPSDEQALKAKSNGQLTSVLLDVTSSVSIAAAAAQLSGTALAGIVNNAGIAISGPLELLPIDLWRKQLEVNVIGLVAVTQAFLPALREGRGRIVNIGSVAGRSALPCSGAYSASKFAVEAITDALRMELAPWGMSVSVIEPGAVATPIWDKGLKVADDLIHQVPSDTYALYSTLIDKLRRGVAQAAKRAVSPDEVAQAVEHALTSPKPRTRYPVGKDAKMRLLVNWIPDRWKDRLILNRVNSL